MTNINIEIPNEIHKKAKIIAAMEDITLKEFINKAIADKLNKHKLK
jgi:predicted HicB family RNase H-like nuclease